MYEWRNYLHWYRIITWGCFEFKFSVYLQELSNIGVNVYYHSVVGDNAERLGQVISNALERSDIIIATGVLVPLKMI